MINIDLNYCLLNVGVGLGIAADAMLATVARTRSLNRASDAFRWAGAIGLTHWLFPMVGFLGGWFLVERGLGAAIVYGTGGAILTYYVITVLRARSSVESATDSAENREPSFLLAVWAVSIDALVTGPGKSAATAHWTAKEVGWSFPFVGAVVFLLVLAAAVPALRLNQMIRRKHVLPLFQVGSFFVVATWIEVSVFVWFCILSFVEAADLEVLRKNVPLATSIGAAAVIAVLIALKGKRVAVAQFRAASDVITAPV